MDTTLTIAVALTVAGYLLLLITGVNGIRHARLMGLGLDGYIMASVWLFIAISGSLNVVSTVALVLEKGMPVGTLFKNGELLPYTGLGTGRWVILTVGLAICLGLNLRSFVMVRNAQRMTKEMRAEHAKTYSASLSLKAALRKDV